MHINSRNILTTVVRALSTVQNNIRPKVPELKDCLSLSNNTPKVEKFPIDLTSVFDEPKIAFKLLNVFTKEECNQIINFGESYGFKPAGVKKNDCIEKLDSTQRTNSRIVIFDKLFERILYTRLKPYFETAVPDWEFCGFNERIKLLKYSPGQYFAPHYDSVYIRNPEQHNPKSERSPLTAQFYLNDGFSGGETTFINPKNGQTMDVVPKAGAVLIFQKDILHQGSKLLSGVKYSVRTGVMFKRKF